MAAIKSFTSLEQSHKLAEILPLESADMYLWSSGKRYYITYPHMSDLHTKADNLVDACVAMIERLHELNLM